MDMDAKEAAAAVLADESYGAGTKLLQELRVKLNKNMFPVAVAPTAAMLAGIAAEERINRDKELKKKVTDVLKEKYLSSFRFNNSNDHKPVVASDDVVLQGHQPITFHSSVKDVVGSIDFDYNSDCVIELKHAEKTYNLKDPVAASKGKSQLHHINMSHSQIYVTFSTYLTLKIFFVFILLYIQVYPSQYLQRMLMEHDQWHIKLQDGKNMSINANITC